MKPRPTPATGTVPRSNARWASPARCGRSKATFVTPAFAGMTIDEETPSCPACGRAAVDLVSAYGDRAGSPSDGTAVQALRHSLCEEALAWMGWSGQSRSLSLPSLVAIAHSPGSEDWDETCCLF